MRAVAALLARVKIYYNTHPYGLDSLWFGSIVAWINCGLDCVKFWSACHCYIGICSTRPMFNMNLGESNFGQWEFVKLAICAV